MHIKRLSGASMQDFSTRLSRSITKKIAMQLQIIFCRYGRIAIQAIVSNFTDYAGSC